MNAWTEFAGAVLVLATAGLAAVTPASKDQRGERIFAERCAYCHGPGGWGTRSLARRMPASEAALLDRADLPPAYTAIVVRQGIGAMPRFNPSELSDADLKALARWLEDRN